MGGWATGVDEVVGRRTRSRRVRVVLDGRQRIYNGSIYAVGMNETILLKKLEPLPGGKVRVISDNRDEYPPYVADAAAVRIIGQVVWYARHLLRGG